jgi:hypothetical protein
MTEFKYRGKVEELKIKFRDKDEALKEADFLMKIAEECYVQGAIIDSPSLIEHGKKYERKALEIYEAVKLGEIK